MTATSMSQWWWRRWIETVTWGPEQVLVREIHFGAGHSFGMVRFSNSTNTSSSVVRSLMQHLVDNPWNSKTQILYYLSLSRRWLWKLRLLECKNPVRTWQETHYSSATEPIRLMPRKTSGFHGGDYEECVLWYVAPCGSCNNRRFRTACSFHL
jgi:hypothetical protein